MQNLKDTVDQIRMVKKEYDALCLEIEDAVIAVAKRYINAYQRTGYGRPSETASFTWSIRGDLVDIWWDELWNYGGEDSGGFEFPLTFVWSEELLIEHEKATLEKTNNLKKKKKEKKEQEERRKLRDLLDKYPEEK